MLLYGNENTCNENEKRQKITATTTDTASSSSFIQPRKKIGIVESAASLPVSKPPPQDPLSLLSPPQDHLVEQQPNILSSTPTHAGLSGMSASLPLPALHVEVQRDTSTGGT